MKIGDNKNFLEQTARNIEAYYSNKDICARTGWKNETLKADFRRSVQGLVDLPPQQGKTRQHSPNEVFLLCVNRYLISKTGFMATEAKEILENIYATLVQEYLLPECPLRRFEYYDVVNGKIPSHHNDEGEEVFRKVYSPDFFSMDILIMRSVKQEGKPGRFFYKTYQIVSEEKETVEGVELMVRRSIESEIVVNKPGEYQCDTMTVYRLPITELLTKFRIDFNCPGRFGTGEDSPGSF